MKHGKLPGFNISNIYLIQTFWTEGWQEMVLDCGSSGGKIIS
jgi:hypothetical protein